MSDDDHFIKLIVQTTDGDGALFRGIIKATKELEMTIPLIVRLQGTKEAEAKKLVSFSPSALTPRLTFARPPKAHQGQWHENLLL